MPESQLHLRLNDLQSRGGTRIEWVAGKRLVAVDLPHHGSHQHELNGSRQLKEALGLERIEGRVRWIRLSDDEGVEAESTGAYTWYDARDQHATRTEHRFYYDAESLLSDAEPGDLLILLSLAPATRSRLIAFIVPGASSLETQLCWLFGLDPDRLDQFVVPDPDVMAQRSLRIEAAELLEALGFIRAEERPPDSDLGLIRRRFGEVFPPTAEMSAFAREQAPADAKEDPDAALLTWIEREEELFRALEEYIVLQKLDAGFGGVDDFISFSLSVQNRRKVRMGFALEHHLRAVFDACGVKYSHQPVTEHGARPDFLFPGIDAYRQPSFPADSLRMLGAKSTCKDRWRQILSEAERIVEKHLCTLEPGISIAQTDEMQAHRVHLVVPAGIQGSYVGAQRPWLLPVSRFVDLIS